MINQWLVTVVIAFVLRQLGKFQETIDWTKVKADLDQRTRDLVPGTWFDDEAVAVVDALLSKVQFVLSDTGDLTAILQKLAASDWTGAYSALKALVLASWGKDVVPAKSVAAFEALKAA